jgi:hypothetical protein
MASKIVFMTPKILLEQPANLIIYWTDAVTFMKCKYSL